MSAFERLPDAELEVMLALWAADGPMKVAELRAALAPAHAWQKATVQVLLDRLVHRGFVTAATERNYKRYTPAIAEADYRAAESSALMHKLCRGSVCTLLASLIESDTLSEADLDDLEALLNRKRGERHD